MDIIKRDGTIVSFDVTKIKKVIEWACEGTAVNPLVLESHFQPNLKDKMSTAEIQQSLISAAVSLTNIGDDFNNLDWRIVAARLMLLDMYKKSALITKNKNFGYGSYEKFVKLAVKKGLYDEKILQFSHEDFAEMEEQFNIEYDREYDYAAMNLMNSRYLIKDQGDVFELPQYMYASISLLLSLAEPRAKRLEFAKKVFHATASRKISLATPIILNLRRPGGNLASCFITAMDDSLDSIYYTLDQLAQISKNAGGVGVNISRVRSHGATIKNIKGASGGVLPWAKLINDTAVAVNQLGSRAGAITVALDVWHRDIEEFLEVQTENGDQRKKAFDIFPQIVFPDLFMKRVEKDESWTLFDPHEVRKKLGIELAELSGDVFEEKYKLLENSDLELTRKVSAKDLFKKYLKSTLETGLPYAFFKDTTNRMNPNKHVGMIGNANLCTESFSNFSPTKVLDRKFKDEDLLLKSYAMGEVHTCNLVSLNLAEMNSEEDVEEYTRLSVRILDNTIDASVAPIPEAHKHNNDYRILGIGSLGLADWMAKRGIIYGKEIKKIDELFEQIALNSVQESIEIAKEKGSYKYFEGSDWSKGILFGKSAGWFNDNAKFVNEWKQARLDIKEFGMRNGGLLAIAPNTSSSLMMGASASVLPIYRKFFVDKASNGAVPVCPPFLSQKTMWKYVENQHIDQQKVINVVSTIQKWTDQGISMELIANLQNPDFKAKDLYDMYLNAWKKGCKTVYYIRSITQKAESDCISCAN